VIATPDFFVLYESVCFGLLNLGDVDMRIGAIVLVILPLLHELFPIERSNIRMVCKPRFTKRM